MNGVLRRVYGLGLAAAFMSLLPGGALAQKVVLDHGEATVVLEPYAPNIIRVTLSKFKEAANAAPGYGFVGTADATGWQHSSGDAGDSYVSSRLQVTVNPYHKPGKPGERSQSDIGQFFVGSAPYVHVLVKTADGKTLVDMENWSMADLNYKDGTMEIAHDRRPTDAQFYTVGATFASPADEHYYGLGQNQEGFLDLRGHTVRCQHDYLAAGGPSVCVPFLVTNKGYGLIWDNPSKTTIMPGFNEQTRWSSEVGDRVSFFVIAGNTTDEIYAGYRQLTGVTHLLPKAAYGYIQCKQKYSTQDEVLAVARGYRERHLPADVIVIDWFYYTKMGQMDMDPVKWPDPTAMNKQLHDMGFQTMISVWPRFVPESRYYDLILKNGWFEHLADGTPTNGLPYDRAGSDIDSTNPDARKWYWSVIRDNLVSKGFDSFWADETEPDLPPNGSYFHIGPGTQFFNVYPLFHTGAIYDGFRRDLKTRALILARDAYIGAQHNGTIFWSSDINGNWDTLKRQVPTGINFVASGMPYWSTDIGGWQYLPHTHVPEHPPLLDPSDARAEVDDYDDYPELYTRWFEYGTFQPNFRAHGSRPQNEVWSYGAQAEPILEKYLRLRYQLMPYIYSLGYATHKTGAPFMRGLFMDFGADPKVADIGDEYMFGPALLIAPVTDQGKTTREVYLPAGTDWFNFWTNERIRGGQSITADAPIDVIPIFVRAGSILPLGEQVESTNEEQKIATLRVYPGSDADFDLYNDDGTTYEYEHGKFEITHLHWSKSTGVIHSTGASLPAGSRAKIEVIGLGPK